MAAPTNTLHYEDSQAEIHKVVVGPYENNVFVLRCKQTGDAVLLDAANEHELLLELCRGLGVNKVLETHGHMDHIQAVPQVRAAGIDVGIAAGDHVLIKETYDFVIDDGDVYQVGKLKLHTIATPGHTPGSMCFVVEDKPLLFSGDTLFPGGPGNTSLEGGDFDTIIDSVERLLFAHLSPDTIVMPGHGLDTTIGDESPKLQEWIDRGW